VRLAHLRTRCTSLLQLLRTFIRKLIVSPPFQYANRPNVLLFRKKCSISCFGPGLLSNMPNSTFHASQRHTSVHRLLSRTISKIHLPSDHSCLINWTLSSLAHCASRAQAIPPPIALRFGQEPQFILYFHIFKENQCSFAQKNWRSFQVLFFWAFLTHAQFYNLCIPTPQ
jgi:hypothetical protein